MRKILFITVQYTGTRFTLELVKPVLGEFAKLSVDGAEFYHHHCMKRLLPRFIELRDQGYDIITTFRNYEDTKAAWRRRFGDGSDQVPAMFHEQWEVYADWVRPNAMVTFQPCNEMVRDHSLDLLNNFLDSDLTTDWIPIGHDR